MEEFNSRVAKRQRTEDHSSGLFGNIQLTKEEQEEISQNLNKNLGPEFLSTRTGAGGAKLTYLEGSKALELANMIFGFNGWSSSIKEITVDYLDEASGRYSLGLSCIAKVMLKDGTFREVKNILYVKDIGYGTANNMRSKGEAFEKAKKEAVTDATKRCLRSFGNALGNCIYNKTYLRDVSFMPQPQKQSMKQEDLFHTVEKESESNVSTVNATDTMPKSIPNQQYQTIPNNQTIQNNQNTSFNQPSIDNEKRKINQSTSHTNIEVQKPEITKSSSSFRPFQTVFTPQNIVQPKTPALNFMENSKTLDLQLDNRPPFIPKSFEHSISTNTFQQQDKRNFLSNTNSTSSVFQYRPPPAM